MAERSPLKTDAQIEAELKALDEENRALLGTSPGGAPGTSSRAPESSPIRRVAPEDEAASAEEDSSTPATPRTPAWRHAAGRARDFGKELFSRKNRGPRPEKAPAAPAPESMEVQFPELFHARKELLDLERTHKHIHDDNDDEISESARRIERTEADYGALLTAHGKEEIGKISADLDAQYASIPEDERRQIVTREKQLLGLKHIIEFENRLDREILGKGKWTAGAKRALEGLSQSKAADFWRKSKWWRYAIGTGIATGALVYMTDGNVTAVTAGLYAARRFAGAAIGGAATVFTSQALERCVLGRLRNRKNMLTDEVRINNIGIENFSFLTPDEQVGALAIRMGEGGHFLRGEMKKLESAGKIRRFSIGALNIVPSILVGWLVGGGIRGGVADTVLEWAGVKTDAGEASRAAQEAADRATQQRKLSPPAPRGGGVPPPDAKVAPGASIATSRTPELPPRASGGGALASEPARGSAPAEPQRPAESGEQQKAGTPPEKGAGPKMNPDIRRGVQINQAKIAELATIQKGEGITHALRRQLEYDPKHFGAPDDVMQKGTKSIHTWAGQEAHRIAVDQGYVSDKGETRVNWDPQNKVQYKLDWDQKAGKPIVVEGGTTSTYAFEDQAGKGASKPDAADATGSRLLNETSPNFAEPEYVETRGTPDAVGITAAEQAEYGLLSQELGERGRDIMDSEEGLTSMDAQTIYEATRAGELSVKLGGLLSAQEIFSELKGNIGRIAEETFQQKIGDIYRWNLGPFSWSYQATEWEALRGRPAADILIDGNYGEPVHEGNLSMTEYQNRKNLSGYLELAWSKIGDPHAGETTEEYLRAFENALEKKRVGFSEKDLARVGREIAATGTEFSGIHDRLEEIRTARAAAQLGLESAQSSYQGVFDKIKALRIKGAR